MSRTLDNIVKAILDNDGNIPYTILVRAQFRNLDLPFPTFTDGAVRLNLSGTSVYWNEEGLGDKEYLGAGNLVNIAQIEEGTALQDYTIQVSFSGIPVDSEIIPAVKNAKYKNGKIMIYLALLDEEHNVVYDINEQEGPVVLFSGRMDTMKINLGKEATIAVTAASRLSDWERTRGGRYNSATQNRYYDFHLLDPSHPWYKDSYDRGFEYVESLKNKEVWWGGKPTYR
jgi:hypothetical protein